MPQYDSTPFPRQIKCIVVTGPTATGKTRLGVGLAVAFSGEIVSADSRQVYRGMDIGSGKDLEEYRCAEGEIPVHVIDVVDPQADYHLFRYLQDARAAIRNIAGRARLPIIVGGTPLYINALLNDYTMDGGPPDLTLRRELEEKGEADLLEQLRKADPEIFARTDKTQRRRIVRALEMVLTRHKRKINASAIQLDALLIAPYYHRAEIHRRIEQRLSKRLHHGLVAEVEALHSQGVSWERLDYFGLEYRYVARFLKGDLSHDEMREQLLAKIRRFCKSQDVWFRKMEREGRVIHWIPKGDLDSAKPLVSAFLAGAELSPPAFQLKDILYGPRS